MTIQIANDLEQRIVELINAERVAAGLEELKIEAHLNASAQDHSDWMADTGELSHTGADGSNVADRAGEAGFPLTGDWKASENLAYVSVDGAGDEAERMHEGLMNSPGHRANILDPDVDYVGVGLSSGTLDTGQEALFLTQNFGDTEGRVLVQEETEDGTVLQPYEDGAPVGEPQIVEPPEPPEDPDDEEEDESGGGGGGCFVATAAYGDRAHPDVAALRRFRDEVLVRHALGRGFIRAYWVIGPRLAAHVAPEGPTGRAARAVIAPLARLARRR